MSDALTPMQQIAYDTVSEILDMKRGCVEPCMAHIAEIRNSINIELMEALRGLYRKGIIATHLDIGKNPMFTIKRKP